MTARVEVFDDLESLSVAAAERVGLWAREAVSSQGRFLWALSGGHTPRRLYELLAAGEGGPIPWKAVHVLWGDERFVPPGDPDSNVRMATEALLARVPIPPGNVHRPCTEMEAPRQCALAYEGDLRLLAGSPPRIDLALLGLGPDGHTASLFPGSPALDEKARWVVCTEAPPGAPAKTRISLTLPALRLARRVLFLAGGADKAEAVRSILGAAPGGAPLPAARVEGREETLWLLDRAAAGRG